MRTTIWLLAAAFLASCGHPGGDAPIDGGDAGEPGDADAGPEPSDPLVASLWLSLDDGSLALAQRRDLSIHDTSDPAAAVVVEVDPTQAFQVIDGLGASLTESSAYLLAQRMSASQRRVLLRRLFDPAGGIGLTQLRQPIGASDFALADYSYDDTAPDLDDFSIAHDQASILPVLQEIAALAPRLQLFATPWSPPGWMKTSGQMVGGTLVPERRALYAGYIVAFLQAYAAEGLHFAYVTPQNEPHFSPAGYPGMRMEAAEQAAFVRDQLGPQLAASGLATQILVWDHNWNEADFASTVLADEGARAFVAGSAFHCYGGNASAQTPVHDAHPELGIWMTECSSGAWNGGYAGGLHHDARLIIGSMRSWARAVITWNLALDETHGPTNGGCVDCAGTVQVRAADGHVTPEAEYVALGHVARFLAAGARRVASSDAVSNVAFVNPDGSIVVFVDVPDEGVAFELRTPLGNVAVELPGGSIATVYLGTRRPSFDRSGVVGEPAALDGDPSTAWTGTSLAVDLGASRHVSALSLDAGEAAGPQAWKVETSLDGVAWTARAQGAGEGDALLVVRFPRVAARYLRVLGDDAFTVAELNLHDP
jgi:glucosylceramidase